MKKNSLFALTLGLVAFVAALLWLLSLIPATSGVFGAYSLGWAIVTVAGVFGVAFIVRGLVTGAEPTIKRLNIFFGAALIVVALLALVGEIAWRGNLVLPIIAVVMTAALVLGFVAVRGGKWDEGDNHKPGYKSYRERKAEEEQPSAEEKDAPSDEYKN